MRFGCAGYGLRVYRKRAGAIESGTFCTESVVGHGSMMQTRHLNSDGTPKYTNHLAAETSPYLRKHAHNPVEWYPWGVE
ncbi:MAG: DUF255 domain-containing protein, partial [Gammaproteobacteria bacterium]|nr:DUF255 domain-containing protein [Gammaproteobacteria bacterium]